MGTVLGYFEQQQAERELFVPEFIDNKKKRLHKRSYSPLTLETGESIYRLPMPHSLGLSESSNLTHRQVHPLALRFRQLLHFLLCILLII